MFDLTPFKKRENALNSWMNEIQRNFWPEFFGDEFLAGGGFKADVKDNGREYLLEAELPGFSKDDIQVEVNEGYLTISAQKEESNEERNGNYLRKERRSGQVTRSFALDNVASDAIHAEYKDGILRLTLPKLQVEEQKKRRIDID